MSKKRISIAAVVAAALAPSLAACGGSEQSTDDGTRIALMIASLANSPSSAIIDGAKAEAKKHDATIDVLAADFDPQKQYAQFQDAITTGKYDGILIQPLDGASICSLVPQAVAADIAVGAVNSAIGTDFNSPDSNCDGVSASVVRPFATHGTVIGELTVQACQELGADPCKVGFMQTAPGVPFDTAILEAFTTAIGQDSSVELVAKANSQASRDGGLTAMQQIVAAHLDVDVVVGPEQSLLGGLPAIEAAHLDPAPKLVGIGGGFEGAEAIENGTIYGLSVSTPGTEGELAVKNLVQAIETGEPVPGIDSTEVAGIPGEGRIVPDNVAQFHPEFHN